MKTKKPDEGPRFVRDARDQQSSTLPPDLIAKDRYVNDVLWNGPRKHSRIQKAGALVIGGALFLGGTATAVSMWEVRSWIAVVTTAAIASFGGRIIYKSLRTAT